MTKQARKTAGHQFDWISAIKLDQTLKTCCSKERKKYSEIGLDPQNQVLIKPSVDTISSRDFNDFNVMSAAADKLNHGQTL